MYVLYILSIYAVYFQGTLHLGTGNIGRPCKTIWQSYYRSQLHRYVEYIQSRSIYIYIVVTCTLTLVMTKRESIMNMGTWFKSRNRWLVFPLSSSLSPFHIEKPPSISTEYSISRFDKPLVHRWVGELNLAVTGDVAHGCEESGLGSENVCPSTGLCGSFHRVLNKRSRNPVHYTTGKGAYCIRFYIHTSLMQER